MNSWLFSAHRLWVAAIDFVIVTVASTHGSTPRETGARMLVTACEVIGTVGGGHLEYEAIALARELLERPPTTLSKRFALGPSLGQCCGGAVELLFEHDGPARSVWLGVAVQRLRLGETAVLASVVDGDNCARWLVTPNRAWRDGMPSVEGEGTPVTLARELLLAPSVPPMLSDYATRAPEFDRSLLFMERLAPADLHVMVFGAGHVGRALISVLGALPCRVTWVDNRESEFCRPVPDNVVVECTDMPEAEVAAAEAGTCFLVMTHSHALDLAITAAILQREDFRYFGLIGSMTKRKSFEHRLLARGVSARLLTRMRCPVGIDGIDSKEPNVIAVAVAAELLQQRGSRTGVCKTDEDGRRGQPGALDVVTESSAYELETAHASYRPAGVRPPADRSPVVIINQE